MTEITLSMVTNEESESRLDKIITNAFPEYSRTRLQAIIKDGHVRVNGVQVLKSGLIIEKGASIEVDIPPSKPTELIPENIPIDVIFENDDLMVLNKPAGMVVHPSAGHSEGTLVHAVLAHTPGIEGVGGEQRPGIVHRLDKDTSGLILLAKNDSTHRWLQDQFKMRVVKKVYIALVDGQPPTQKGRIDAPIGRDTAHRKKMAITTINKGREAVTDYFTLQQYASHTLIEAHPHTGRTHQIRIHLSFIGCPIVGDLLYGHKNSTIPMKRHFLHAKKITIQIPGEDTPRTFEAPLPSDLEAIIKQLS